MPLFSGEDRGRYSVYNYSAAKPSSFISFYLHLSSFIYKLSKVSDAFQKREGDVREDESPSRAFSPLYIGI